MQLVEKQDLTIAWPRPEVIKPALVGRFGEVTQAGVGDQYKAIVMDLLDAVKGKGVTDDKTKIVVSLQGEKTTCTDVKKICGIKVGTDAASGGNYKVFISDEDLEKYFFTKAGVLKLNVYLVNISDESVIDSATVSLETYAPALHLVNVEK
jgi:hypothetical protein